MSLHRVKCSSPQINAWLFILLAPLLLVGCADGNFAVFVPLSGCADSDSCVSNPVLEIDAERPARVQIPADYNTATRYPLIIVLHGFGASGPIQALYFGLDARVDTQQFVMVTPNGTINSNGSRYWNATPACCAGPDPAAQVDDVGYVRGLIEQAANTYSIDTRRVALIGHSNGGFMALRMACEASDVVTSVVSLAGSTFEDAASCAPATHPVNVLTLHGDDDATIPYDGSTGRGFPGALETIARFAGLAGCNTNDSTMLPNLDVDASIDGAETEVLQYNGCPSGIDIALWTMRGSPHIPFPYIPEAIDSVVDWMIDHTRS